MSTISRFPWHLAISVIFPNKDIVTGEMYNFIVQLSVRLTNDIDVEWAAVDNRKLMHVPCVM